MPVSELPFSTPGQSSQPARWCPCGWPQQLSGSIAATFVPMIYQCNSMCWHYHIYHHIYHHCWWIIISYDNSMPIMCLSLAVISYLDFPLAISEPVWHRPRTLQRECDVADKNCTYLQVGCGCMAQRMARACANDKWESQAKMGLRFELPDASRFLECPDRPLRSCRLTFRLGEERSHGNSRCCACKISM